MVWDMLEEKNRCLRLDGEGFDFERGRSCISVKALEFGMGEAKRVVRKEVEQMESHDTSFKKGWVKDKGTSDAGEGAYEEANVVQVRALQTRSVPNFPTEKGGFKGGGGKGGKGGGNQGKGWQSQPTLPQHWQRPQVPQAPAQVPTQLLALQSQAQRPLQPQTPNPNKGGDNRVDL